MKKGHKSVPYREIWTETASDTAQCSVQTHILPSTSSKLPLVWIPTHSGILIQKYCIQLNWKQSFETTDYFGLNWEATKNFLLLLLQINIYVRTENSDMYGSMFVLCKNPYIEYEGSKFKPIAETAHILLWKINMCTF